MFERILKWFSGIITICYHGDEKERFLNLCRYRNLNLTKIYARKEDIICMLSCKDYFRLKPILKKCGGHIRIRHKRGFPIYYMHLKKRYGLLFGIGLFLVIHYTLALFVWEITIHGNLTYTTPMLMKYLRSQHVYAGMRLKNVRCEEIEELLREKYNGIGWVSADIDGTKLQIVLKENGRKENKTSSGKKSHLVASHSGVVTSILTRAGTPKVLANDRIKKGDILISGVIEIIGDNKELLRKYPVRADGDILLKTNYHYKDKLPVYYNESIYTGKCQKHYRLRILDFDINFPVISLGKRFKHYVSFTTNRHFKLNPSFSLPIRLQKTIRYETTILRKKHQKASAKHILNKHFLAYQKKIIGKGVSIIKNNVKIEISDNAWWATGDLIVKEPVTKRRVVTEDEWRPNIKNEFTGIDD
ncbi:MAG: sporulation protein YqfD [Lachnospiraceae bacterium]|nr:sporulation protein YqfD [Lachnospiraceae bacterium]